MMPKSSSSRFSNNSTRRNNDVEKAFDSDNKIYNDDDDDNIVKGGSRNNNDDEDDDSDNNNEVRKSNINTLSSEEESQEKTNYDQKEKKENEKSNNNNNIPGPPSEKLQSAESLVYEIIQQRNDYKKYYSSTNFHQLAKGERHHSSVENNNNDSSSSSLQQESQTTTTFDDNDTTNAHDNSNVTTNAVTLTTTPGAVRVAGIDHQSDDDDDSDAVISLWGDVSGQQLPSSTEQREEEFIMTEEETAETYQVVEEAELVTSSSSSLSSSSFEKSNRNLLLIQQKIIQSSATAYRIEEGKNNNTNKRGMKATRELVFSNKSITFWILSLIILVVSIAIIVAVVMIRKEDSDNQIYNTSPPISITDIYGSRWAKYGEKIIATLGGSDFGESLDFNKEGTRLAIGVNRIINNGAGAVQIMEYNSWLGDWEIVGSLIEGRSVGDNFGSSVQLNHVGDVVVVGGYGSVNNDYYSGIGSVTAFQYDNYKGDWSQIGQPVNGIEIGDRFGISLSMASDKMTWIAGADTYSSFDGYARVYEMGDDDTNDDGNWKQRGSTIYGKNGNQTGRAVAMSGDGDTICVSDLKYAESGKEIGRVRCYYWSSGENDWKAKGSNIFGNKEHKENFGYSLSLNDDGTVLAVGASERKMPGFVKAYQFMKKNNEWKQKGGEFKGEKDDDRLGHKVALNGDGNVMAFTGRFHDVDVNNKNDNNGIMRVVVWHNDNEEWIPLGDGTFYGDNNEYYGEGLALNHIGNMVASSANWAYVEYVNCFELF